MVITELKKELAYSKNITSTSKYIILYKGASISIYDQSFVCVKKISKLRYVYDGYVSPDEKRLLLVSSCNCFYILSLEDFLLGGPFSIKAPYNGNLEGLACWRTSDSFMLPIVNKVTMLSKLVKINCDFPLLFEDIIPEKFWIRYITFVDSIKQYLLIGWDRCEHSWNIIWLGAKEKYTVHKILDFDEALFDFDIVHDTECLLLTGETKVHCCDFRGFPLSRKQSYTMDFDDYSGFVLFFKPSQTDSDVAFVGTTDALLVYNLNHKTIVKSYSIEYGARDIKEFGGMLFVSTYSGIKVLPLN